MNPTTIKVTFNQDPTADDLKNSNFTISKGSIDGVSATGKVATISVSGLTYGDTPTLTVVNPAHSATVTVPQVSELYELEVLTDADADTIKSDGASKTQITVILRDKTTGQIVEEDGIVQFQATRGGLGQTTSALQKGKATVQLTSVASATSMTSIVTATVSDVPGAAEFEGLTNQKAVIFSPDAVEAETKYVQALEAESTQGDRLHVTFSDKISASAYKKAIEDNAAIKGQPTPLEYGLTVNGHVVAVSDVIQLTDNTLEFILDTDSKGVNANPANYKRIEAGWGGVTAGEKNYLRDNVTHTVELAKVDDLVLATNPAGIKFILTDTSRPGVLGVTAKDQLEFSVRFTESMDDRKIEELIANTGNLVGTIKNPNFLLDGDEVLVMTGAVTQADVNAAKAQNQVIMTSLQLGDYSFDTDGKAVDTRNITTFKLHKDFALTEGSHQIQIANVGDWAQDVHPSQNMVVTDTFDFDVSVDNSKPVATIEVQSAEQWRVNFDKPVSTVGNKKAEDVFEIVSADEDDTFVYGTDYIVSTIDKDGEVGTQLAAGASISAAQYFLIEFTQDWTVKYDTATNPSDTYFASTKNPYVVTLDNVESLVGNKMVKKDLDVNLSYDGQSPKIAQAEQLKTPQGAWTSNVRVTMSEPVKNVNPLQVDTLTPSQQQTNGAGVPQPTYEFVKGNKVVEATANTFSYDDRAFTLSPVAGSTLESGEWTLYIRSISDDIGNTSATESKKLQIVIPEAEETGTKVAWAAFDDAEGDNKLLNDDKLKNDIIYVKFTKKMQSAGAAGVSRTQNYVFKGAPLPTGSQVIKGITGVTKDWDGATIIMPKGTWDGTGTGDNDFTNTLNIASNFTSAQGESLSGAFEVELTDTSTNTTPDTLDDGFEALYRQDKNQASFNGLAAAIAASADDTDGNGKIDEIILTLDKESLAIPANTEILVNGKKFETTGGSVAGAQSITFTAMTTNNEIDGTATNNLKVTGLNGAIIINTDSVVDSAAPVITKSTLNSAKDKITLTFSEGVTQNTNGTFKKLEAGDFTLTNGTVTGVEHDEATPNRVVLTITGGATLTNTDTITVQNTVHDFAVPANTADNTPVVIGGAVTTRAAGVTVGPASNVNTGVAANAGTAEVGTFDVTTKSITAEVKSITIADGTLNETVFVSLTDQTLGTVDATATEIRNALAGNVAITNVYTVGGTGADIVLTQINNTGDVTITATLNGATNAVIGAVVETAQGVAASAGTLDKDKFTVTAPATSAGYIVVRVNDDTGLTGGPIDVTVSGITTTDTVAQIATKIANALTANATIGAKYTVTTSGADVELEQQTATGANTVTVTLLP